MALDGITLHALAYELNQRLQNQRISKIAQPEKEELLLTFKITGKTLRLLLSANASLPFAYFTEENKQSPLTAPNFCMVLRKYIGNGRIVSVTQPGLERVLCFTVEHLNELGDSENKFLYVELMGKHSNLIFCDQQHRIIDSIKHVSAQMSSVREVLPGRTYFIPAQDGKRDPMHISEEMFYKEIFDIPVPVHRAIYTHLTGISPFMAQELCFMAGVDGDTSASAFSQNEKNTIYHAFCALKERLETNDYQPVIIYDTATKKPLDFSPFPVKMYRDQRQENCGSMSEALELFFAQKNKYTTMHQKSADLRRHLQMLIERNIKKYDLQTRQKKDTQKREKYRLYGELLHAYGYQIAPGAESAVVMNYYDGKEIRIPLDAKLSAMENAQKFFDRYQKLKRTDEALAVQIQETEDTLLHLKSALSSLNFAETEEDLSMIREELTAFGYLKRKGVKNQKCSAAKSKPLHFIDANGFHIYVGKNNYQNDALTFRFATGNDWWFHAKGMPGSHVIVKAENKDLPDDTFETAAAVAAWYSDGRESDKVEVDYLQKKNVKKPAKAVPGFVVYYTNYSMTIHPSLKNVQPFFSK